MSALAPAQGGRSDLDPVPRQEAHRVPKVAAYLGAAAADGPCAAVGQETESGGAGPSVPTKQRMPKQGGGSRPASHYFRMTEASRAIPDDDRTEIVPVGPRPMTTKSSYNRLAKVPG